MEEDADGVFKIELPLEPEIEVEPLREVKWSWVIEDDDEEE